MANQSKLLNKIGKESVVILPLAEYEEMKEDLEMLASKNLRKRIAKARRERKFYTVGEVKKILGL